MEEGKAGQDYLIATIEVMPLPELEQVGCEAILG